MNKNPYLEVEPLYLDDDPLRVIETVTGAGYRTQPQGEVGYDEEEVAVEGVTSDGGAFYTLYVDSGDTYLQCGSITGGNGGSDTIADEPVLDAGDLPAGVIGGHILAVQANVTATISDGIMLPGCGLNSASIAAVPTLPQNHQFTVASPTGSIYTEVGRWNETEFLPSAIGNLYADGCIGSFNISRR